MRKILILIVVAVFASLWLGSCCKKCVKAPPVVRVSYMVPEFACPVPAEPNMKPITPEIVADDLMFKKTMGDNIVELQKSNTMWRAVYYECVQSIIKLYRNENEKINIDNAEIDKANEALPQ